MEALILDGCREATGIDRLIAEELGEAYEETRIFHLRHLELRACVGCFGCWIKTPGVCVIDDDGRAIARAAERSHLLVCLTPVTFGGYSSLLKRALDRRLGSVLPFFEVVGNETRHKPRYRRTPRLVTVGLLPEPDPEAERLFEALAHRNALNIRPPGHSAGVLRLNETERSARLRIRALLERAGVEHEREEPSSCAGREREAPAQHL
jgi:hypothetical protein